MEEISTEQLIEELEKRSAIERVSVGRYAPYELKMKYVKGRERENVINADILIITSSRQDIETPND